MNWYKIAQGLEIVDYRDRDKKPYKSYVDIAHEGFNEEEVNEKFPNYMWGYIKGKIDIERESHQFPGHDKVPRWQSIDWATVYSGRYSSEKKVITIVPPSGIAKFREIPNSLRYLLKQEFPEALNLYVYSNSNNYLKQSQSLDVIDHRGDVNKYYTDIGHEGYSEKEINLETPNYMWLFINGQIEIEEESPLNTDHGVVPKWSEVNWASVYSGRYSPKAKSITIIPPFVGSAKFREIPNFLRSLLRQKFPEALKLQVFGNSNNYLKQIKLAINGAQFVRELRTFNVVKYPNNYKKLINLDNGKTTIIHDFHRGKDLGKGILIKMLKELGINPQEFYGGRPVKEEEITEYIDPTIPEWKQQPWAQKQLRYV